jgi:hypothetical protein
MIRNPELRRNLWLEFTANRLLIGPLLLLVLFTASVATDWSIAHNLGGADNFSITSRIARWCFFAIVLLWGGRQAAGAVIREIRNRTWDGQRMSVLGPWAMALGKLIGATAYTWALGLCCLVVYVVAVAVSGAPTTVAIVVALSMAGFGMVCQTVGLLLSLTRQSRTPGFRPGNITLIHFVALLATVVLLFAARTPRWFEADWYGFQVDNADFAALTAWFFALWGVVGINRRMRRELQFRNKPFVWLIFLVVLVAYVVGFGYSSPLPGVMLALAFNAVALFAYLLILFEPKDPEGARRVGGQIGAGGLGAALSATPLWLLTLAVLFVVFVAGLILIPIGVFDARPEVHTAALSRMLEGVPMRRFLYAQLIASFLFVLRDVMIVLAFCLSREERQGEAFGFVVLFVLYVPLPFIALTGKLTDLLTLFWPIGTRPWSLAVGPVAVELLVVAAILWWRWRRYWRASRAGLTR